jgi:hypothetical protein
MFQKDIVFYLGSEKENGFSGVIAENGYLLVLEVDEGLTTKEGREKLAQLKDSIVTATITKLSDLETVISEKIKEYNFPANISLAVGYVKDMVLYLKTIGEGRIYLRRGNKFGRIIEEEQSASGHIQERDIFLFTTEHFINAFGGEKEIKNIFDHKKPHEIIDEITPRLKGNDDQDIIALFAQFNPVEQIVEEETKKEQVEEEPLFTSSPRFWEKGLFALQSLYAKAQGYSAQAGEKKKYTFIAIIIIFCVLVWSVGLGYTRRSDASLNKKIQSSRERISQKLNQADEASFLNLSQSLVLIAEARKDLEVLQKDVGDKKQKELKEIEDLIREKENKITKREEKRYEEFYDLAVDNKQAKGTTMYLSVDNLSILDNNQGIIYTLSLTKKSLDKRTFSEMKSARKVAQYQNDLFFFSDKDGIYKITSDGKLTRVIEKDKEWGTIVDLWLYNGNIYALDATKNEIYKYLVAENGYSGKTSYFKGGETGLKDSNSLAIDSSVYVGFSDHIFKFTGGSQDEFKTSFPEANIMISKIFTTKDLEKVYAWDKKQGSIYILSKNGTYEKEIHSSILKQADDFIVFENSAYLLSGQKIYSITL